MVSVSATAVPVSGSLPVALSMTIAFLPSPLSWMSATSLTTLSAPAAGSGANSRMLCDPCSSRLKSNDPMLAAAANGEQAMTA